MKSELAIEAQRAGYNVKYFRHKISPSPVYFYEILKFRLELSDVFKTSGTTIVLTQPREFLESFRTAKVGGAR